MAKEFDIYLNRRLTECDIIVYSIPFRDGLTVMDRLILESCIESYTLQKFIAVQTGSDLVHHIDEMLKTCYEKLNCGVKLGAEAEFDVRYSVYPQNAGIVVDAEVLDHMATTFDKAENAIQFGVAPIRAGIAKSLGNGRSDIEVDAIVKETLKNSILTTHTQLEFGASVDGTNKHGCIEASAGVVPVAELTNLCYRVYRAADAMIQIAAEVVETEIHFSLGSAQSDLVIGSEVTETSVRKYEAFEDAVVLMAELTEKLIQVMEPEQSAVYFIALASAITKRYRLLNEMDNDSLSAYDDMTLDEVDYVILAE